MHSEDVPVACTLSQPEKRTREATLVAEFKSRVLRVEEIDQGYAFELPGDPQTLRLVTDLIVAERDCCPFLTFNLDTAPSHGPITLRMTGPVGTKPFLESLLI
jgi:hypothetical protein